MKGYCTIFFLLAQYICRAQDVNDWVKYGNYPKTGIYTTSINALLSKPVMICKKDGCIIRSFDMYGEQSKTSKEIGPVISDGSSLSAKQRKLISKVGDKGAIWIYNVRLECNDGTNHTFGKEKGSFAVYYFRLKDKK